MISLVQIYNSTETQKYFSGGMCRTHIDIAKPNFTERGFHFYVYRSSEPVCILCEYAENS